MTTQPTIEPQATSLAALLNLPIEAVPVAELIANGRDYLSTVPREIRLQIFERLLTVNDNIYCRARDFGRLEDAELSGRAPDSTSSNRHTSITWEILLTRRQYYAEAMPIMYQKNVIILCAGKEGTPGLFHRFPIKPHCMPYINRLGLFFCADDPRAQCSIRVALFIKALAHHARKLRFLEILVDSVEPWNMLFYGHPVTEAIEDVVRSRKVQELLLRFHNGTTVYPPWADYLVQLFNNTEQPPDHWVGFAMSCRCTSTEVDPKCRRCETWYGTNGIPKREMDFVEPRDIQTDQWHMMAYQEVLFEYGLVPFEENEYESYESGKGLAYARWDTLARIRQTKLTEYYNLSVEHRKRPLYQLVNKGPWKRQARLYDYQMFCGFRPFKSGVPVLTQNRLY